MGILLQVELKEGEVYCKWLENRFRQNKNVLGVELGCLSEDTILYGQTKTLKDLYALGVVDTYSLNKVENKSGTYYPVKSKSKIIHSGIKEVFEIELENGKKVIATSEHRFFKKKGGTFEESELKDLKVGDELRDFPIEYISNFFNNAKSKERLNRDNKHKLFRECSKCKNLFYIPKGKINPCSYCRNCITSKNDRELKSNLNVWHEWEDNIIRNFYYDYSKDKLMELLPLRKSWSSIMHRAKRLNIKRNPIIQWKDNAFTSKNNPMNYLEFRKKASCSQQGITLDEWNGFKSFEPYTSDFNNDFKEIVKIRDNFLCLECGISEQKHIIITGRKLNIHHIDYIKENSYLDNCVTLCSKCHTKTNANRKHWIQYFRNKLSNLYNYSYEINNVIENVYNKN